MIYLILAGLVLAIITVLNVLSTEPMPAEMEEEEEQSRTVLVYNEWTVSPVMPRSQRDRFQDLGGEA